MARTSASRARSRTVVRTAWPWRSSSTTHQPPRNPEPPLTSTVFVSAAPSTCRSSMTVRASPRGDRLPGQARRPARVPRSAESGAPEIGSGEALLRVDTFGLTANNITYAVMGEAMSYWDFFPAEDGWGRVPMWGFAEVERSEADGVEPGTRVYGYLPPSSHLVVTPADAERGAASSTPRRTGPRCPPPTTATWHRHRPLLPAGHRGRPDAAAAALLHLVPDRRPARRRGAGRPRADA